jgi:hypothetical protein
MADEWMIPTIGIAVDPEEVPGETLAIRRQVVEEANRITPSGADPRLYLNAAYLNLSSQRTSQYPSGSPVTVDYATGQVRSEIGNKSASAQISILSQPTGTRTVAVQPTLSVAERVAQMLLEGYSQVQQKELAARIYQTGQQGGRIYLPPSTAAQAVKGFRWDIAGLGLLGALAIGGLIYVLVSRKKSSSSSSAPAGFGQGTVIDVVPKMLPAPK